MSTDPSALTKSERREIVQRAKPVVDKVQIRELNEVIELLSEAIADRSRKWFLIIDGLDEPWAEQNIQYNLIRALIESIRTFRKMDNLKIIVVLRDDLYEKVISKTKRSGFQSEKYEGIIAKVKWSPGELRMLINKRIEYLFVRKYEKRNIVKLYDVIPSNIRKFDTYNFVIMRTLFRPRDIIAFINEILENAAGKTEIGYKNVRDAEFTYSKKRLTALEEEWSSMHPMLGKYVSFLANRKEKIPFTDISVREFIEDMVLAIVEQTDSTTDGITELAQEIMKKQTATRILNMSKEWVLCLYKVGAIGVKPELGSKFLFSHADGHQLSRSQLSKDTILSVHPMLWRSLNITPNI
ncbi:hypothetical protein BMS3Bbin10_00098 [bacterium BMS3Bbin10]|nr:hypothetical protein BMS3Bbin10_00098 [bacterium BMS3Bbin10]